MWCYAVLPPEMVGYFQQYLDCHLDHHCCAVPGSARTQAEAASEAPAESSMGQSAISGHGWIA